MCDRTRADALARRIPVSALRWPGGFRCPRCAGAEHYRVSRGERVLFQCRACRHQASLTAGTVMDSSKLPLRLWFLAMYLISQAKTGLSALALMRHLGVSYRTAWLVHQKIMGTMAACDAAHPLQGDVQVDDAYLGGERPGTVGRGSPNKVPFIAAVSLSAKGHPLQVKMSQVSGFTLNAVTTWARSNLLPGTNVLSDGLNCFAGVIDAGCAHSYIVVGSRKPRDLPTPSSATSRQQSLARTSRSSTANTPSITSARSRTASINDSTSTAWSPS